jgi:hypothetical protein
MRTTFSCYPPWLVHTNRLVRNDTYFGRCKIEAASFCIWGCNEELTRALHSSVRTQTCYITRWRRQGSLYRSITVPLQDVLWGPSNL